MAVRWERDPFRTNGAHQLVLRFKPSLTFFMRATEVAHQATKLAGQYHMIVGLNVGRPALVFAIFLATLVSCVPVPIITGPHLQPKYLGSARVEIGTTCEGAIPYVWIFGPENTRQKVLVRQDESGRAMLELSAAPLKGLPSEMPMITISSLTSGRMEMVAAESVEIIGTLWTASYPLHEGMQAAYRVQLPAIDVRSETWRPGIVEFRPAAVRPYLPPLNC